MVYESCPIEAGVREIDSESCLVLLVFRLGEFDEILYGFGENLFRDGSGSVILAQNLKWPIAVGGQIIATICFSVSGCYRKSCWKVVRKTDIVQRIVSSCARKLVTDILDFSGEILGKKIFLELFGSDFRFIFLDSESVHEMDIELRKYPINLFIRPIIFQKHFDLAIKIPYVLHIACGDSIKMRIQEIDLLLIARRRGIG